MVYNLNQIPQILSIDEAVNNRFKLVIRNFKLHNSLRDFEFFFQTAEIPAISGKSLDIATPQNNFYFPGSKINYEELNVSFKVDEDLNTYYEIFQWMKKIYAPEESAQFRSYQADPRKNEYTVDATLFSLTNEYNANIEISFKNLFPVSLSRIDYTLRTESILTANITFRYDYYDIFKPNVLL